MLILATLGMGLCLTFTALIGAACATLIARLCYVPQSQSLVVGWLNGLIALNWIVVLSVMKGMFTGQSLTYFISTNVAIGSVFPLLEAGAGLRVFENLQSRQ